MGTECKGASRYSHGARAVLGPQHARPRDHREMNLRPCHALEAAAGRGRPALRNIVFGLDNWFTFARRSNMDSSAQSLDEPVLRGTSCARLEQLLDARNAEPHRREEFDRLIDSEFAAVRSILVLDMAGFSFSVRRNGIIHHLSLIRQMHNIVRPAITHGGGAVVKFEADNCYAVFAHP